MQRRALGLLSETFADGGIQRFNRTFLTASDLVGVGCDVLSLGDAESARERWNVPRSTQVALFNHNKPRFALAAAWKILRGRYDVLIVGHINLLVLAMAASRFRTGTRVILIAHGIEVWTGLTGQRRRALSRVDSILCVSNYTRQAIQAQAPELLDSQFVIFPNALSESWRSLSDIPYFAHRKQLPERFLLSVSRLDRGDRYKGIVTVIETMAMLDDDTVHYVVAGRGNDQEFLQQVAERFNVAHRVHFIGAVPDEELASLYSKCMAFVLPSAKEGFGIVFLEAMYFGACVVAAAEKGAVDVVQDEQTGLLVPYGDTAALKHSIDRLMANPALRQRLSAAARKTVIGDGAFTFRSYVRRLARVLGVPAPIDDVAQVMVRADQECV